MTQLLFKGLGYAHVDDYETRKHAKAYTLDTLIYLKSKYPGTRLYFIMAADVANDFFSWHEPAKILSLAEPIIVSREGYELNPEIKAKILHISPCLILKTNTLPISSTEIRNQLEQGLECKELSEDVKAYIKRHKLYQNERSL